MAEGLEILILPILTPTGKRIYKKYRSSFKEMTTEEIQIEIQKRANRFKNLYPNKPLIIGEFGYPGCGTSQSEIEQSKVLNSIISYAVNQRYGFNLWQWLLNPSETKCLSEGDDPGGFNMSVTNADGSHRKVLETLPQLISPIIIKAGVTTSYNPWAVWVQGNNLSDMIKIKVFDKGTQWGIDIPISIAQDYSWLSFLLPDNIAPSGCNIGKKCLVQLELEDSVTELTSNKFNLTLLAAQPTPSPSPTQRPTPLPTPLPTATPTQASSPVITRAGVNSNIWAAWVLGRNFQRSATASVIDSLGNPIADNIKTAFGNSGYVTFDLPNNLKRRTPVRIQIANPDKGASNWFTIYIP